MLFILALLIIIGLAALPGIWGRTVMARHSADRPDFPGTGAEFARYLLEGSKRDADPTSSAASCVGMMRGDEHRSI